MRSKVRKVRYKSKFEFIVEKYRGWRKGVKFWAKKQRHYYDIPRSHSVVGPVRQNDTGAR